uniref:Major sperm protein n=1 Tax=Caenorhabditis tropicalis TaxID=1561998 RepID=A0A1I7U5M6_9PELO
MSRYGTIQYPKGEAFQARRQKSNPTEVYVSTDRDLVQRTLVFRNTTGKDFLLKLIASHEAVTFPTNVFRFPPTSHRVIQFRVNSSKLGQWDKSKLTIKGYVMPVYAKNLKSFIDQKTTAGTTCQEAFSLAVKFTDQFSAPQTIVNLPGSALCIESTDHPVDIEEMDTHTALNIERDVVTAAPIGSMLGFVENHKRRQENNGCWLSNYVCGGPAADKAKPSMRSRRSSRSASRSGKSCRSQSRKKSNVNVCLGATPCGGSSIQA